jgi:hypothetical protein
MKFHETLYRLGKKSINTKLDCAYLLRHINQTEKALRYLLEENVLKETMQKPVLNIEKEGKMEKTGVRDILMAMINR